MTFDECVEYWHETRISNREVEIYTADRSKQCASMFSQFFGNKQISKIKPADVIDAMNAIRGCGSAYRGDYTESTIRKFFVYAKAAIEFCIQSEKEKGPNPFNKVKRPKVEKHNARFLTPEEAAETTKIARNEYLSHIVIGDVVTAGFWLAVCIALGTGARRGEIFALEWQHIDLENKKISIVQAIKGGYANEIGGPKSRSSIRQIAIGDGLAMLLASQKKTFETIFSDGRDMSEIRVLCDTNGKYVSMNTFEHWWRLQGAPRIGKPELRFHELRHTHATLLIVNGVDVKTVQTRLGHSDAEITLNTYTHALPEKDLEAGEQIDKALF